MKGCEFMQNKESKKIRKVHIKYENIISILYIMFAIYQTWYHITLNGLYPSLILENMIHIMFISAIHYIIKDIRTNKENWTLKDND